jgi:putative DNA primase/helicase
LWRGRRPLALVEFEDRYLNSRALDLPPTNDLLFHPSLNDYSAKMGRPGMVAVVRRPDTGEWTGGIHRTYLADDGGAKAAIEKPKKMLGPCQGGVVMLMPMTADGLLGIGEGIETSLAAAKFFSSIPVWAALSASGMRSFLFPPGLRRLVIYADRGKDGEDAAWNLYPRAVAAGIRAFVLLPKSDDDFASDLASGKYGMDDYRPEPVPETEGSNGMPEVEIIAPAPTLEALVGAAQSLTHSNDPQSMTQVTKLLRDLAVADLDAIANDNVLSIIKQRTGLRIGSLRETLNGQRRRVGAESRAVVPADGKRHLDIGSDVEIAERVITELRGHVWRDRLRRRRVLALHRHLLGADRQARAARCGASVRRGFVPHALRHPSGGSA